MGIENNLKRIRTEKNSTSSQRLFSFVCVVILGGILGLVAKLVDTQGINPIFDDIGGRLGIWIFVAVLVSVFSYTPKLAAVKIFFFFSSLLIVYYLYTVFFLHFFSVKETLFWGICAVLSPVCAYVMWYARGNGYVASIILSLPVAVLLSEGYELRNAYLPEHEHYYLVPILMGIYLIMIIIMLLVVPEKKFMFFIVLLLALMLSFIMMYFNVLRLIFGGLNGLV